MEIILSIGSFTAFVFALILFTKKGKQLSDKILSCWMLVYGLNFLFVLLGTWKCLPGEYFWIGLASVTFITHFPVLYNYALALTVPRFSFKRKKLFYIALIIVVAFVTGISFILNRQQLDRFSYDVSGFLGLKIFIATVVLFVIVFYLSKTYRLIQTHKANIKNIFSYQEKIDLVWVQRIVWGFAGLFSINFLAAIFMVSGKISVANTDYIMYTALVLLVFYIGYWGYKQGRIFYSQQETNISSSGKPTQPTLPKEKTNLTQKKLLQERMETEKPFLNPELTLYDLSKAVNIPTRELSSLLNHEMDMNFYEFVNRYRVREVKKRLETDSDKFTILAIALDCGFNSKASFNRIFKQITEFTPTEYMLHKRISR